MKIVYFETSKSEGKGMREGPKAAALFELSSVPGLAAGWAVQVSCLSLLQPLPFTAEPNSKPLVPSSCSRMQIPTDPLGVHLLLILLPYDHNTGLYPVHSMS